MNNLDDITLANYPHLYKLVNNSENNGYLDYYPDCKKGLDSVLFAVGDIEPQPDRDNVFRPRDFIEGLEVFDAQSYETAFYNAINLVKANSNLSKADRSIQELHSQIQSTSEINNVVIEAYKLASKTIYDSLNSTKKSQQAYTSAFNFVAGSIIAAAIVATGGAAGIIAVAASAGVTLTQQAVSEAINKSSVYGLSKLEEKILPELTMDTISVRFDYSFETMRIQNITTSAINEIYLTSHRNTKKAIKASLYLLAFQKKEFNLPADNEDIYKRHKAYYSGVKLSSPYIPNLNSELVNSVDYFSAINKLICLQYCISQVGVVSDDTIRSVMNQSMMTTEKKSHYQALKGKYRDNGSQMDARLIALKTLSDSESFDQQSVESIDQALSNIPIGGRIDALKDAKKSGDESYNTLTKLLGRTILAGISITRTN